jgi:diguanylate cyclase (GGDEF)-like protein
VRNQPDIESIHDELLRPTASPLRIFLRVLASAVLAVLLLQRDAPVGLLGAWFAVNTAIDVALASLAVRFRNGFCRVDTWHSALVARAALGGLLYGVAPLLVPSGERSIDVWLLVLWISSAQLIASMLITAASRIVAPVTLLSITVPAAVLMFLAGGASPLSDRALLAVLMIVGTPPAVVAQRALYDRVFDAVSLRSLNANLMQDVAARGALAATVLNTAGTAIFTVDGAGAIRMANPAAAALTAAPPEALIGRNIAEVLPESGPGLTGEADLYRLDGTTVRVQADVRSLDAGGTDDIRYVVTAKELVDRRTAEARLRYQAMHDDLTGLPNRAALMARAERAAASAKRSGTGYGLVRFDLVDLPTPADVHGAVDPDELLRVVAERLAASVRASDTVARVGDREFVLLAEDVPSAMETARLAGRLLSSMNEPIEVGGVPLGRATVSVGVAFSDAGAAAPEKLLIEAEEAVAQSRLGGTGRVTLLDKGQRTFVDEQQRLEAEIRTAIERDEMELWAQPIVRLDDEQPVAVELLVRWSRDGNMVSPALFIPVAEQSDLILELDRMVVRKALETLERWGEVPETSGLTVGVNISGRHLTNADLAADLAVLLAERPLVDPRRLLIEITETHVGADALTTSRQLGAVRALGAQVAIDDFGTGYASLTALQAVPATELKIDRSFVALLDGDDPDEQYRAASIVQACSQLAQAFGLVVVAEGIETEAQERLAYELGCSLGQGYAFCRPLPIPEAEAWLRGRVVVPS